MKTERNTKTIAKIEKNVNKNIEEKEQKTSIFNERIGKLINGREKLHSKLGEKDGKIVLLEWNVDRMEKQMEQERDDSNYAKGEKKKTFGMKSKY